MLKLLINSPDAWVDAVMADFDTFLIDHAAAEKKASGMAISMLSHYPDRKDLVNAMVDLAIEEMTHFRQVIEFIHKRGLQLGADTKDHYVNSMRKILRKESDDYFLDRLIVGGVIEARGCERFGLVADALPTGELKKFYTAITESEARHENLFLSLALKYFPTTVVEPRLQEILEFEAETLSSLPIKAALH